MKDNLNINSVFIKIFSCDQIQMHTQTTITQKWTIPMGN